MTGIYQVYEWDGEIDIDRALFFSEAEAKEYCRYWENKERDVRVVEVSIYDTCDECLREEGERR